MSEIARPSFVDVLRIQFRLEIKLLFGYPISVFVIIEQRTLFPRDGPHLHLMMFLKIKIQLQETTMYHPE